MLEELLTGYSDAGSRTLKLGADCRVSIAECRLPRVECRESNARELIAESRMPRVECRASIVESQMPRVDCRESNAIYSGTWLLIATPTMADQTPADKASNRKDTTIFLWRETEKDFSVL
ncbi:hypothetical protein BDB00DRAFT_873693 [Zychaea mexicana]|uniref:uncharacterized protein n=1 Tax=Zychaea mexicana TaxID=64656 RepID=UPI0022FDC050|nr:uncharacterized protein BDB00DRAFT_875808 [Zychaea mexicana]XP_052978309.1 uncharacterized protein BDB00DRAFT_873693 [Zychaea mexicana]KAI9489966.1 hypothetical protein BDB00DRAFT_875808 [Zychaea mexicana]KAI9492044.1 hypothetical protein BDB00DRAFT_873693 [Zychaea mexicana]